MPRKARCFQRISRRLLSLIMIVSSSFASAQQYCSARSAIDGVRFFIGQTYADVLGRVPDRAGQTYNIGELARINTAYCTSPDPYLAIGPCEWGNSAQVLLSFLSSPESISRNGMLSDNTSFVKALYQLLLHRNGSTTEVNAYTSQLTSGVTRLSVVSSFLTSTEYRRRFACTSNGAAHPSCNGAEPVDSIPQFVTQAYLDILGRPSDMVGQAWWTQETSSDLAAMCRNSAGASYSTCDQVIKANTALNFFDSREYSESNPSIAEDSAFVTALYQHLLQREPDAGGLQYYENYVNQTNDRTGAIEAFLTSNEYRQRFSCYTGTRDNLNFGINGHPLTTQAYSESMGVDFNTQMSLIQGAGLKWYRVDVYLPPSGKNLSDMDALVAEAQSQGVQLLPLLMETFDRDKDSPDQLYSESYSAAYDFVSRYKSSIHVWELLNEEDLYTVYRPGDPWGNGTWPFGAPPGDSLTDYYPPRLTISESILHGFADGARAADPSCIRLINFAWLHTGFIEHLEDDAIPYDVIGVHWYSNSDVLTQTGMGDITCPAQNLPCATPLLHFNLIQRAEQITGGKPVWVTETNYTPVSGNSFDTNQSWEDSYLAPALQLYMGSPSVYPFQVVFIYELLDEPAIDGLGPNYGEMGLYEDTISAEGYTTLGPPKAVYQSIQQLLTSK